MTKELQDLVWSILPKEFKEEVKKIYSALLADIRMYQGDNPEQVGITDSILWERTLGIKNTLCRLFGHHNLTSDAEGEDEMLYVSRKRVQELYSEMQKIVPASEYDRGFRNAERATLYHLFGSKCLPDEKDDCQKFTKRLDDTLEGDIKEPFKEWRDENSSNVEKLEKNGEVEPKPAEPKFKCEDRVRIIKENHPYYGKIATVDTLVNGPYPEVLVNLRGNLISFNKSDLEPYNEPEEEVSKMKPIESKVRVYLVTKEEDEEFRQLLHKNGFEWNTGESLIDNSVWSFDKEESKIHNIYPNKIVTYSRDITPNILSFYKFKKQYFEENVNLSQETANCDKHFDNILKDSFAKERRLNIAAMVMQGIMANPNPQMVEMDAHRVADLAILMADTLIAECEKGDSK